jgi:hypothetical protein
MDDSRDLVFHHGTHYFWPSAWFFLGVCPMENQTIFHAWGTLAALAPVSAITQ